MINSIDARKEFLKQEIIELRKMFDYADSLKLEEFKHRIQERIEWYEKMIADLSIPS